MFNRITYWKRKLKKNVNKCSAKHVLFEASVDVNNISENNIMCSLKKKIYAET